MIELNNEEYTKNVNAPSHPQDLIWSNLRNEGERLMLPVGFKMMGIYNIAINTTFGYFVDHYFGTSWDSNNLVRQLN